MKLTNRKNSRKDEVEVEVCGITSAKNFTGPQINCSAADFSQSKVVANEVKTISRICGEEGTPRNIKIRTNIYLKFLPYSPKPHETGSSAE